VKIDKEKLKKLEKRCESKMKTIDEKLEACVNLLLESYDK